MAGRPSNFGKVNKEAVELMCRRGFTDAEIQKCLHVSDKTWSLWKKKNADFFDSIKSWKAEADHKVERALYERATGYNHPETKAQWITDENGGRWETIELDRHYPPDPTSMIFWLKNRQPDQWRDKQDLNVTVPKKITVVYEKESDAK